MALAERALGGFAHRGEGRDEDVVERLAGGDLVAGTPAVRARSSSSRQRGDLRLQRVDGRDLRLVGLEPSVVGRAEHLLGKCAEHRETFFKADAAARGRAGDGVALSNGLIAPSASGRTALSSGIGSDGVPRQDARCLGRRQWNMRVVQTRSAFSNSCPPSGLASDNSLRHFFAPTALLRAATRTTPHDRPDVSN